jgi:hypothetical protein
VYDGASGRGLVAGLRVGDDVAPASGWALWYASIHYGMDAPWFYSAWARGLSEHEETVISGRAVENARETSSGTPNVKPQGNINPVTRGETQRIHSGSKPSRIREEFLHASPLAIARRLRDSLPSDCLQLRSGRYLPLGLPGELGRTCIRPTPSRNSVSAPVKSSLAIVANSAHMRQIEFRLTGLRYRFISVLDLSLTSKMSIGRPACCKAAEMSMH